MSIFNLFKREPHRGEAVLPDVFPGGVRVDRNWSDDPTTDTTIITIGGQITSRQLVDIKAILEGKATAHRKPKRQEGQAW